MSLRRFMQIVSENACLREFTEEDLAREPKWTPERGINDYVRWIFSGGCCNHLAASLHDVTGWPIYGTFSDGSWEHFWVVNPSGNAVDIDGIWNGPIADTPHFRSRDGAIEEVSRESLHSSSASRDELCDLPPYRWARLLIKRFPDHFGL